MVAYGGVLRLDPDDLRVDAEVRFHFNVPPMNRSVRTSFTLHHVQ